ncbi:MAG: zinc ribbon domain-containing protein [Ruminococcus sp.]|nr:zinc ribbon domain-containing protein [Ruminococcus sp.]
MIEKRRCPNCGAYLRDKDTECYVCGEVIGSDPNSQPRETEPNAKRYAPVYYEPEADEDFVTPVNFDEADGRSFEERVADYDDDMVTGKVEKPQPKEEPMLVEEEPAESAEEEQPAYEEAEITGDESRYNFDEDDPDDSYDVYDEPRKTNDKYKDFTNFDPYANYEDEDVAKKRKKRNKTILIIAVIIAVLGIAAVAAAFLYAGGFFGGQKQTDTNTVYFDKPNSSLILRDADGKGYSWEGDVVVCYSYDNREDNVNCSINEEYDNIWTCKVPKGAENVYFYNSSGDKILTAVLSEVEDNQVYYVTDISLDEENRLPVAHCDLEEFDNFGVNATKPTAATKATEKETEKATKATKPKATKATEETKATEKATEDVRKGAYTVEFPANWKKGVKKIVKDNCATYYEKYNYAKDGSGMLLSIYVFPKGDTSYGDLNAKKVLSTSDGRKIVVVTPTDIQFDDSDEDAAEKYLALEESTNEIISSITPN